MGVEVDPAADYGGYRWNWFASGYVIASSSVGLLLLTPVVTTPIAGTESGTGTDTGIKISQTYTESGTGTDNNGSTVCSFTITDTGTGTEVGVKIAQTYTDTGAGSDSGTLGVILAGSESGGGTDVSSLTAYLTVLESGAGTDQVVNIDTGPIQIFDTDSGVGFEVILAFRVRGKKLTLLQATMRKAAVNHEAGTNGN